MTEEKTAVSQQDGTQASTKRRRSRQTRKHNAPQATSPQLTTRDDTKYWETQGQEWRTEPEIGIECQRFLDECRSILPNIQQGIYLSKDIASPGALVSKLTDGATEIY
jgi:hypothetical protein